MKVYIPIIAINNKKIVSTISVDNSVITCGLKL